MKIKLLMSASSSFDNYKKPFELLGAEVDIAYLPKAEAKGYDGLVLCGGCDVKPFLYGQKVDGCRAIDDLRDAVEMQLIEQFIKQNKPILGICRGHQILNVYFEGTLFQHIKTAEKHVRNVYGDSIHIIETVPNSIIANLYGDKFFVNSAHHQAIDKIGKGLIVTSRSEKDEIVESFEHESLPVYGVQFHPERMCVNNQRDDTIDGIKIFEYFYNICLNVKKGE
jgi:putative glutamine amidotransferase